MMAGGLPSLGTGSVGAATPSPKAEQRRTLRALQMQRECHAIGRGISGTYSAFVDADA